MCAVRVYDIARPHLHTTPPSYVGLYPHESVSHPPEKSMKNDKLIIDNNVTCKERNTNEPLQVCFVCLFFFFQSIY